MSDKNRNLLRKTGLLLCFGIVTVVLVSAGCTGIVSGSGTAPATAVQPHETQPVPEPCTLEPVSEVRGSRFPGPDSCYFAFHSPVDYLSDLRMHPDRPVMVLSVPDGWITFRDAEKLMQLIDRAEPASPVVSPLSSFWPTGENSTVGNEAMFLLEGYREGTYPPALSSVYYAHANRTDMRAWWEASGKKGFLDEKAAIRAVQNTDTNLFAYPNGNFPVKSIITDRAPGGWYVAFIMEGSGVPIVSARCYYVGDDRTVRETGNRHGVMVMPQDFSAETCG